MIGRFLLGAGLGGLVGTGVLALVSINVPLQRAAEVQPPAPEAASHSAQPSGAVATVDAPVGETVSPPAVPPQPQAAMPEAEPAVAPPSSVAAEVADETAGETAAEIGSAASEAPAGVAADTDIAPPAAAETVELRAERLMQPPAGDDATTPPTALVGEGEAAVPAQQAPAGVAPGNAGAEAKPAAPETPARAPELGVAAAPELGSSAGAPSSLALQAPADAPAPPSDIAVPAAVAPSRAPVETLPDLSDFALVPRPLTAEEEALLARIAAEGPDAAGSEALNSEALNAPDAPVPPPADPEAEPAAADPAADALQAADAAPDAAPDDAPDGAASRSTLPPAPALPMRGAEQHAAAAAAEVGRLPRIGDPAAAATQGAEAPLAAAELPPITRFARSFDNAAAKPTFAIILIDTGAADLDRQALAALPFPVSFALDPQNAHAADYAKIYRAAGQEVVMLATFLPKGATAQDVEVAFGVTAHALPEAVAVMDVSERRFQADRPLATLVVPAIEGQGRGLITWNEGLNAADQVARRADLPAAVIFRNLDASGEATPVIRRYLDRAAFKAAQENSVIVVGQTRPETVAALLEWTVEGRAATVALAPVTAVMSAD